MVTEILYYVIVVLFGDLVNPSFLTIMIILTKLLRRGLCDVS